MNRFYTPLDGNSMVYDPNHPSDYKTTYFEAPNSFTYEIGGTAYPVIGVAVNYTNPTAMNTVLHAGTWTSSSVVTGDNYRYPIVSIPTGGTETHALVIDRLNPTAIRIDFEEGYVVGNIEDQHFCGTTHNLWGARRWVDYETMEGDSVVIRSAEIKPDICVLEMNFVDDLYFQTEMTFTGYIPQLDMSVWVSNTSTGIR